MRRPKATDDTTTAVLLRSFSRRFRSDILGAWRIAVRRSIPVAHGLTPVALVDHVPEMFDEITDIAASIATQTHVDRDLPIARHHALERLAERFDAATIVKELSILRGCMLASWQREHPDDPIDAVRAFDLAIDRVMEVSVAAHLDESAKQIEALSEERAQTLAKLESLLATSPVGIGFVDRDLRYQRVNAALATLNGAPVAAHVGRTVREVIPDFADQIEALLRGVLDSGEPQLNLEVMIPGKTETDNRWLLANYFPVRAPSGNVIGIGAVVLDVTETRRAREALRLEQARLRSIVEHAPAAIWIKDSTGNVVFANHRLADALGVPVESLAGRRSDHVLPPEIATQHQAHDEQVLRENRSIEVEEVTPSEHGLRTFLSIKFPIPGDPPLVGGIATEITDRKRMEEALRDAVRMRDDVLAVVSHDLRSPVAAVQLSAALLLAQLAADPRARRHVEMIARSCTRMETLIDDLLDTASIRAGRFELEMQRHIVDEVVSEALDLQEPLAIEKGVRFERRCTVPGVDMACDRDRILQVFGNLIGNAIKFCRPGDTIRITSQRDRDEVAFTIEDTGPGIAADIMPRLFEPYWSAPGHRRQGAGLGLYIVRGIVESHGGRVWAESTPGAGARFSFTLPIAT